jgi:hypothetical protein
VDGTAFDALIKQFSTARVTRATALRGLVASATALTGMRLRDEEAGAGNKKRETKRKWCHRGDDFTILGKTKKLTKEQRKTHKKKHAADYKGTCGAARIVPAGGGGGGGGGCADFTDCDGRLCLNGRCLADVSCEGIVVGNDACDDLLSADLTPMLCNENGSENPNAPANICSLDMDSGIGYTCISTSECATLEDDFPGFTLACVDFICVVDCRAEQQAACNAFEEAYPSYGSFACVSGACLREVV